MHIERRAARSLGEGSGLGDGQGIADALELLADMDRKYCRSGADAADFPTRIEVVRPLQDDILWRRLRGEEHFEGQHRGILCVSRAEGHPLGAGVIADLPFVLKNSAPFILPSSRSVIDIVEDRAFQHQKVEMTKGKSGTKR